MINSRDISDLRDDVKQNVIMWKALCASRGLNVLITSTLRDDEYQATLYAQGRTKPGNIITNAPYTTFHGQGLAFDFCKNVRGHEYDDLSFFKNAAAIAKTMGFTWGGDWRSFVDRPHLQWDNHTAYTTSMLLKYKKGVGVACPLMPTYEQPKPLSQEVEENMEPRYQSMYDIEKNAPWAVDTIQKLCKLGAIRGGGAAKDDNGYPTDMNLSVDMIRLMVIDDRIGLYPTPKEG